MSHHRPPLRAWRTTVFAAGLFLCVATFAGAADAASNPATSPSSAPPPTSIAPGAITSINGMPVTVIPPPAVVLPSNLTAPATHNPHTTAPHEHTPHNTSPHTHKPHTTKPHSTKPHSTKPHTTRKTAATKLRPEFGALGAFGKVFAGTGANDVALPTPLPVDHVRLGGSGSATVPLSVGTVAAAVGLLALGLGVRVATRRRRRRAPVPEVGNETVAPQPVIALVSSGEDTVDLTSNSLQHQPDG
jgi:hypothetical protein